ncbi:MAG: glycosyltransferase family 39 protein [Candidatus Krumholzibacteria bacterium]|nr:glycosyltransferase family 39 protein [Candidatus Krumholzibacteria bacterium]
MTPDRRTLLALFAIAFGLRLLYAAVVGTSPDINPNPSSFDYRVAQRIHDNLAWIGQPFTPSAPGYPLALALVFRVLGVGLWRALIFNAAVGAAMTFFMYRIGEQRLGRNVGLFSALWLGLYVHHMHLASIVIRDTLVAGLFLWFVFIVARPFHRMRNAVWAGVLYAALTFVEPMLLLLLPIVVVFLALYATGHRILSLQYAFLFVSTVFILNVPWTIRNYAVYGEPVVIALEWSRYLPGAVRPDAAFAPDARRADRRGAGLWHNAREFWRVVRSSDSPGDPARGVGPEPAWSLRHNAISLVNYGLLLPFAIAGAVIAVRRRRGVAAVLVGFVVSYFALRLFVGGGERARLPAEPLIILLAFYGLMEAWAWRRRGVESSSAEP